jgi:peptide/nickel transport system permease protein
MGRYILRRLLIFPFMLLGITLVVFVLIRLAPGDPIAAQYGLKLSEADPQKIERLRREMGLYDPLPVQYLRYLNDLLHGNMGLSISTHQPVLTEIAARFPATLELALSAMLLAILLSIPLGVLAGLKHGTLVDSLLMGASMFGVSVPSFWLGIVLLLVFGLWLHWLPGAGRGDGPLWTRLNALILPAVTLAVGMIGLNSRILRSSIIEVLSKDYIRTARGKGVRPQNVIHTHALPNALIALVTVFGMQFANLLGGAVVIEMVFAWPGIGRLAVNAVFRRDTPVIMGTVLVFAFIFMLANLVVDLLYSALDPRIRYE